MSFSCQFQQLKRQAIFDFVLLVGTLALLCVLTLTPTSGDARSFSLNDHELSNRSSCDKLLGMVSAINNGVDLTKVELNSITQASAKAKVFDFTCNDANPPFKGYQIPDQIIGFDPIPSQKCGFGTWSSSLFASLAENFEAAFGGGIFLEEAVMSDSVSFANALEVLIGSNGTVGAASCKVSAVKLLVQSSWELQPSRELQKNINHFLKPNNASQCIPFNATNSAAFDNIIETFGTAVITDGVIGGLAQYFFGRTQSYEKFMDQSDIEVNSHAVLFNFIAAAGGVSGHLNVSEEFSEEIIFHELSTIGGDVSPFANTSTSWNDWVKSIYSSSGFPAIIHMNTANLSSIVSNWDPNCGRQLDLAIINYYIRSYAQNILLKTLNEMQTFYKNNPPSLYPACQWKLPTCTEFEQPPLLKQTVDSLEKLLNKSPITPVADVLAYSVVVASLVAKLPLPAYEKDYSVTSKCVTEGTGCWGPRKDCSVSYSHTVSRPTFLIDTDAVVASAFYGNGDHSDSECSFSNCFSIPQSNKIVAQTIHINSNSESCKDPSVVPKCPGRAWVTCNYAFKVVEYGTNFSSTPVTCPPCKKFHATDCP
eukprot:m.4853 g.4853  ORF g.4853 m.4853 type:complete len:593 (-) comp4030_c0_seq1:661-2439(-)